MYAKIKQGGGPDNQKVDRSFLTRQVAFLSKIFRNEFVYDLSGLTSNIENSLEYLRIEGVISVNDKYVELSQSERQRGRDQYDFYCFLLWPFVECFWTATVSLFALMPQKEEDKAPMVVIPSFQNAAQLLAKTLYAEGDVSYYEAVNKETLKSAFTFFEEEGIITTTRPSGRRAPAVMALSPEWMAARDAAGNITPEGRLWDFAEQIAISRREGKNRRDSATVSTRVLRLADQCGRELLQKEQLQSGDPLLRARRRQRRAARL